MAAVMKVMALDPVILVFLMLSFKPVFFSLSSFTFIKRLFSSSSLSATGVVSSTLSEVIDISPSGVGNGNLFLENSMDRGAWQATVHGVTKIQT